MKILIILTAFLTGNMAWATGPVLSLESSQLPPLEKTKVDLSEEQLSALDRIADRFCPRETYKSDSKDTESRCVTPLTFWRGQFPDLVGNIIPAVQVTNRDELNDLYWNQFRYLSTAVSVFCSSENSDDQALCQYAKEGLSYSFTRDEDGRGNCNARSSSSDLDAPASAVMLVSQDEPTQPEIIIYSALCLSNLQAQNLASKLPMRHCAKVEKMIDIKIKFLERFKELSTADHPNDLMPVSSVVNQWISSNLVYRDHLLEKSNCF